LPSIGAQIAIGRGTAMADKLCRICRQRILELDLSSASPDCRACRNELSSLRHMAKKPLEKGFVSLLVKSPKASV
jgi:hypothetical protein